MVITIRFDSPETQFEWNFYVKENNKFLNNFKEIFSKCFVDSLEKEKIQEDIKYIEEQEYDENELFELWSYIDFNKFKEKMSKYGFEYINSDITYNIGAWTCLTKDLKLQPFDEYKTELEKLIEDKLQENKEELLDK